MGFTATGVDCEGTGLHAFDTIQEAVDAATAGDTVNVCPGTYTAGAVINKALNLRGAKAGLDGRPRSTVFGSEAESFVTGCNPIDDGRGIFMVDADNVTIDGFWVGNAGCTNPEAAPGIQTAGHPIGGDDSPASDFATIKNNVVTNNVMGVYLNGHQHQVLRNRIVANNTVGSASGNGIYSDQNLEEAEIDQNLITNHGNTSILFPFIAGIEQSDIEVSNNSMDHRILAWTTRGLWIHHNSITGTFGGSALYMAGDNDNLRIENNTIQNAVANAIAFDNSDASFTPGVPGSNDGVTVLRNVLRDSGGYGVQIFDEGPAFNSVTGLSATLNQIIGNAAGGFQNDDVNSPVSAVRNWWGNSSGPSVWSIGTGQSVSASVDVFPWATNAARTTFRTCNKTATGPSLVTGTAGSEVICGTNGNNNLNGGGGRDLLLGLGGNDNLSGGTGTSNDVMIGDNVGFAGTDTLNGQGGASDFGDGRGGTDSAPNTEVTSSVP